MPSPFPGMDPYLEHPDIFPDFLDSMVAYLREGLQPKLPEPYYAAIGRRAWIEVSERFIGPDVNVLTTRGTESDRQLAKESVGVVEARPSSRPLVIHVPHDERVETRVDIFMGRGTERRLVTTLELLSLTNKTPGEYGRDLYRREQREILDSNVHLVEIDLLLGGQHTTAVPLQRLARVTQPPDYHVCIHHFDNLEDFFVYPIGLEQTLPSIRIPLLPGDGDLVLDLQQVFERTYESGPYRREIDYTNDTPQPPLSDEQSVWAKQLVSSS